MWKHEILADLKYGVSRLPSGEFKNTVNYWLNILQNEAQSIYAGDLTGYINNLLTTKDIIEVKNAIPPFDSVLVMLSFRGERRAILVKSTEDALSFFSIVSGGSNDDPWTPNTFYTRHAEGREVEYIGAINLNSDDEEERQEVEEAKGWAEGNVFLAQLVFSILNCKNVYLEPVDPPTLNHKHKRVKKKKQPIFRYHVLKVSLGIAKKNKQHIATDNTFDSQPVHICRGHFRHVSEDRPLFGRPGCHGRFWIQAHVRGDKQNGIVVKDYELSPPTQSLDN